MFAELIERIGECLMTRWLALFALAVILAGIGGMCQSPRREAVAEDPRPAPSVFPNNVNTLLQRDSFGDTQNVAYYDADSGLFLGPGSDPRTTIYANVPVNLFRRHVFLDFEEAEGLDPRCRVRRTGSASAAPEMGLLRIRTGDLPESGGELVLPNVSAPAYAGQRLYFYQRTYPAGNLRLTFGLRHPTREDVSICLSRTDADGPRKPGGEYVAATSDGEGPSTRTPTGVGAAPGGDTVRRFFCINVTKSQNALGRQSGEVEFYVGTDGGVLERKATHVAHIPDVTGRDGQTQHLVPFVRMENNASVDQGLEVDVIYAVLLR